MKKTVEVISTDYKKNIIIDTSLVDDIYIEACTQMVEFLYKENLLTHLTVVMVCKTNKKQVMCNTYKILINAGFYVLAENFRKAALIQTNRNWALEPIKSK